MFKPMAITVALALGGALLFSLTAFPALAATCCRSPRHKHDENAGFFGAARRALRPVARARAGRPGPVLAVAALALVGAALVAASLGAEFVPRLDEGELSLDIKRLPSISITEAQRLGVEVEEVLARFPEVISVVTRTGRAEVATDPVGHDETEVMVKLRAQGGVEDRARSRRAGRGDQAGDRGRGAGDVRLGLAADRGPREPAAGRLARRRRDQGVRAGPERPQEDRRRDRQGRARRARPRRLARAARAGLAAAGGQTGSAAAGALRHAAPTACWRWSRRRASGASPARSSRARGAST